MTRFDGTRANVNALETQSVLELPKLHCFGTECEQHVVRLAADVIP